MWWGCWHPGALQGPRKGGLRQAWPSQVPREGEGLAQEGVSHRTAGARMVCQGLSLSWALSPFPAPSLGSESHCLGHLQETGV